MRRRLVRHLRVGQYPNLGVVDAFIDVRLGDSQHIVRSSAPLRDRGDISVGPFRIEVLEPLRKLRVIVEPTEDRVAMDVTWEGHIPAVEEPRQYLRSKGKVVFDTQRLAQTGVWSGTLVGRRQRPRRDTRPVLGHPRPLVGGAPGGRARDATASARASSSSVGCGTTSRCSSRITRSCTSATSATTASVRSSSPSGCGPTRRRASRTSGRAEHEHHLIPGTRVIERSVVRFPEAGIEIACRPFLANFVSVGTGYGIDADWRHGMYHGPETVTQGLVLSVEEIKGIAQYGIVDHVAEFSYADYVGYGLLEHGFFGPYRRYGLMDGAMGAPG